MAVYEKVALIKTPYKGMSSQVNITKSQNLSNIHLASYFYSFIPLFGRSLTRFFTMSIIGTKTHSRDKHRVKLHWETTSGSTTMSNRNEMKQQFVST